MADPGIQKQILRAVLSLPCPVLRAASGGRAILVGGRTLDPRLQFLMHAARHYGSVEGMAEDKAREVRGHQLALVAGKREPDVRVEELELPGGLQARMYRHPNQDPQLPVLVYAQTGAVGEFDESDAFCSMLARCGHAPVLSVPSRPSADRPFPACLDDVEAAYRYARAHAEGFGAPAGLAAVGGESIGGAFAAILCQDLKRLGEPQPALQLLLYPWVDLSNESVLLSDYAEAALPAQEVEGWEAGRMLRPQDDPADPRISPLQGPDLAGLAPAIVVTAGFDPLLDQGEAYARRLRDAGAHLVYRCYDHLVHGFAGFTGAVPAADIACREIAGLVREGLQGRIPAAAMVRA